MKERPILFSGPMVRAILAGTKTQTRRVMKPQPIGGTPRRMVMADDVPEKWQDVDDARALCPYGVPGDRLWVRETFRVDLYVTSETVYRADHEGTLSAEDLTAVPWRPSIFMPRDRSRLTLKVTKVHVQRLHEITEEEAKAEGVTNSWPEVECNSARPYAEGFRHLWNSIKGKRAPWWSNPFVWAITFKRIA